MAGKSPVRSPAKKGRQSNPASTSLERLRSRRFFRRPFRFGTLLTRRSPAGSRLPRRRANGRGFRDDRFENSVSPKRSSKRMRPWASLGRVARRCGEICVWSACADGDAVGDHDGLEPRVDAKGPKDAADVVPDRLQAEMQLFRDLIGRVALFQQAQDLGLAWRQARMRAAAEADSHQPV